MRWYQYVAYFFGGAFLANAVPHLVNGISGRPFQSPFASPPGQGLSSSTVNVLWGLFNLAVGYGGRQEIVDAVRGLLGKELADGATGDQLIEAVTIDAISENLYTSGQPDPDLVIRTSGEQRLSGFLLWQSAYSEMWFTEAYWPEFRRVDFLRALRDYTARHRRYGV